MAIVPGKPDKLVSNVRRRNYAVHEAIGPPRLLGSLAMVILQKSADTLTAKDIAIVVASHGRFADQAVLQSLVISLDMIMGQKLSANPPQLRLAEQDEPVEALGPEREQESFGVRIQVRRPRWKLHRLHVSRREDVLKGLGEQWVAVAEQATPADQRLT